MILSGLRSKLSAWRAKRKEKKKNKKKPEFSKILAVWAMAAATAAAIASYVLAFFNAPDIAGDITICIVTACVGYLVTYAGKSLGEKISRNRHGIDADGNPLPKEGPGPESPEDNIEIPQEDDSENGR